MAWQDTAESITDTCVDVFSESIEVHYFDKDSNDYEIATTKAVYDSDYKQIDLNTNAIISSSSPMVEISSRFLERALTNKDKIKARGILYKIREIMPDASGAVKVLLSRS
jgi:hypothetical protein